MKHLIRIVLSTNDTNNSIVHSRVKYISGDKWKYQIFFREKAKKKNTLRRNV